MSEGGGGTGVGDDVAERSGREGDRRGGRGARGVRGCEGALKLACGMYGTPGV
ncbi:hypothetical protein ACIBG4_26255 [Nonomuraea sp. NPDC050383]|uniref:hypothetical protein n=1 Tax=Nonomuraea sp. NPDC050383 TaxID=3364362 RepID=UPI0037AF88A9